MKHTTVPIDQAGRIVLPKSIREELAIKPGDTFKVTIEGASVSLTPNMETAGFVRKGRALVFATTGGKVLREETVQNILNETRNERDNQSLAGFKKSKKNP